ncbi:MAG: class I SAM-dependent methyltransferase [Gemmatimonadetes bacterium]|nr:class I SAM-dependent methyltransferase [Gemmatimonadota bacterium]
MSKQLKQLYETSSDRVRPSGFSESTAANVYRDYLSFVARYAADGRLLDLGCGAGWSTLLFSKSGYDAVGLDVTAAAFEPDEGERLRFEEGDAAELPFADATFDVVTSYQFLEHSPDPWIVLEEAQRVLKPGGWLFVVGPNLLGIAPSITTLVRHVWQSRPVRRVFVRDDKMPVHPFGNTLWEAGRYFASNLFLLASKVLSPEVRLTMRRPDLTPPFHADNDSCFLCNPRDLRSVLIKLGFTVVRSGKVGRSRLFTWLAGGTWIAARNHR